MNKKAGVPDGLFYMVAMFAVAIISVVGYVILVEVNDNFQTNAGITAEGKSLTNSIKIKYVAIIDNSYLIVVVGILIGTVAGVWFIRTHPALFWIMIPIFAFIMNGMIVKSASAADIFELAAKLKYTLPYIAAKNIMNANIGIIIQNKAGCVLMNQTPATVPIRIPTTTIR